MFRRGSWLLCWLLVLAQSSFCERRADHSTLPPALRTDVRQLLEAAYANGEFSGIVAVRQHGRPLLEEVFGYADYENRTAFTSHTRFEIASLTKTFTSAAVLRLRDQHKTCRHLPCKPAACIHNLATRLASVIYVGGRQRNEFCPPNQRELSLSAS